MAIGIALDPVTHDLVYQDGSLEVVANADEVARNIKTRLLLARGEYALDVTYGFPYSELFGAKIFNLKELETIVKQFILETQGVTELTRFTLDYTGGESRALQIDFTVQTIFGRGIDITLTPFGINTNIKWAQ